MGIDEINKGVSPTLQYYVEVISLPLDRWNYKTDAALYINHESKRSNNTLSSPLEQQVIHKKLLITRLNIRTHSKSYHQ